MKHTFFSVILSMMAAVVNCQPALGIANGDFGASDLSGWTTDAFDAANQPLDPSLFINVVPFGSSNAAEFKIGKFEDGLTFATLEQPIAIENSLPVLSFDFSLPTVIPDPTGTGSSEFVDTVIVGVDDGTTFFDLLLLDQVGSLLDPFDTVPGNTTLEPATDPSFDHQFRGDLSAFAGSTVTLFIDLLAEDDSFQLAPYLTNFQLIVPEPATFTFCGVGLLLLVAHRVRRRN